MPIDFEKLALEAQGYRARFRAVMDIVDSNPDLSDLPPSELAELITELRELPAQLISNCKIAQQHYADTNQLELRDEFDKYIAGFERFQAFVAGQETKQ